MKVALALLPQFQDQGFLPHLGHACLKSACQCRGWSIETLDFRLAFTADSLRLPLPFHTLDTLFACDIMEIELLWDLITAFYRGAPVADLLSGPAFATRQRFATERDLISRQIDAPLNALSTAAAYAAKSLSDYDVVGFTLYGSNLYLTWLVAMLLKRQHRPPLILMGGPQVTQSRATREIALTVGLADVCVSGPADNILPELLEKISRKELNGPRVMAADPALPRLDVLPTPSFDGVDLAAYRPLTLPLYGSRGCVARCTFCQERILYPAFTQRSAAVVIADTHQLNQSTGARIFHFADSLLNGSRKWLNSLMDGLGGTGYYWTGYLRSGVTPDLAQRMATANLMGAALGIESFSAQVLRGMRKGTTPAINLESINALCLADVDVKVNLIVGYPGETEEEFAATLSACEGLAGSSYARHLDFFVQPFELRAGSAVFNSPEKAGITVRCFQPKSEGVAEELSQIARQIPLSFTHAGLDAKRLARRLYLLSQLPSSTCNGKRYAGILAETLRPDWTLQLASGFWHQLFPETPGSSPRLRVARGASLPANELNMAILQAVASDRATVSTVLNTVMREQALLSPASRPAEEVTTVIRQRVAELIAARALRLGWGK